MKIEIRNNGITDVTVLVADKGKVIRRIESEEIIGVEFWLGKSYYINGVLQDPPHDDIPSDFEEIDATPDWANPEPDYDPELTDKQALNIILNGE